MEDTSMLGIMMVSSIVSTYHGLIYLYYFDYFLGLRFLQYKKFIYGFIAFGSVFVSMYLQDLKVHYSITYAIYLIWLIIINHILYKGTFLQRLYASLTIVFHMLVFKGMFTGLLSLVTGISIQQIANTNELNAITMICATFTIAVFIQVVMRHYSREKLKILWKSEKNLVNVCWTIGIIVILLILGNDIYHVSEEVVGFEVYHMVAYILLFFLFYNILNFSLDRELLKKHEVDNKLYEEQLSWLIKSYHTQSVYIEDLRKFKHDYQNISQYIKGILTMDTVKDRELLFKQMDDTLSHITYSGKEFSNNALVQAILAQVELVTSENQIHFEGTLMLPENFPLTDFEVCRMVTNMMQNALEATEKVIDRPFIKVSSTLHTQWLTLTCTNNFTGEIVIQDNRIQTSKEEALLHGIGLKSIEEIAQAYNGFMNIQTKDKCFELNIHIPIKKT